MSRSLSSIQTRFFSFCIVLLRDLTCLPLEKDFPASVFSGRSCMLVADGPEEEPDFSGQHCPTYAARGCYFLRFSCGGGNRCRAAVPSPVKTFGGAFCRLGKRLV